jgi:hypothetical protein
MAMRPVSWHQDAFHEGKARHRGMDREALKHAMRKDNRPAGNGENYPAATSGPSHPPQPVNAVRTRIHTGPISFEDASPPLYGELQT